MTVARTPAVILASASPRRRELLARLVRDFTVVPADVDESLPVPITSDAVAALALRKAQAIAARVKQGIVLGADTVVVVDGQPLGKPAGPADARSMLRRLRGRSHEVITGLGVVDAASGRSAAMAVVTRVFMTPFTDQAIDDYVATGEPLDKAGAYGIQERGGDLVAGYVGSYSNVIGLPLDATRRMLSDFGV
jgi:septum formation protein